ncbi:MAG: BlaI/MecI/CopY family transcriptional regulator [Defluviitaleaceae bacterium]|nr:BlaI/MecI/CopY family transcriptional regulator [Defluviitaleaceae bacterium]
MKNISLTTAEEKLATLIWNEAPLASPELVALAERVLDWKKSTTYTVLKKLCDKGVFANKNANISILLTHEELTSLESRRYVEDTFGGSLPKFVASFFSGKKLSHEDAEELKRLIDEHEGGGNG